MPLICIGPVCIPISALLPVLMYIARPVWKRLPPATQQLIQGYWAAFTAWTQANLWDRIGWKAAPAPAKRPAAGATAAAGATGAEGAQSVDLRSKLGSVAGLHSPDEWEAALALTSAMLMIVDFTAEWCGPCQTIKPFFAELAAAHPDALFVKVDVDELEEVSQAAGVRAMPTFQVYRNGECVDTTTGARMEAIKKMVDKALKA